MSLMSMAHLHKKYSLTDIILYIYLLVAEHLSCLHILANVNSKKQLIFAC